MTAAEIGARSATTFLVDGTAYGGGPIIYGYDRYLGVVSTADAGEVARRLPSPQLHPLRWLNGRAILVIDASDWVMRIGDLPPVRYGAVTLGAGVTVGRSSAPRVLPLLGEMLPLIGRQLGGRYQWGTYELAAIVTNRVAGEVFRVVLNQPASVGTIRQERGSDLLRVVATDEDGSTLDLAIPTGGRAQAADTVVRGYYPHGPNLMRQSLHDVCPQQVMRVGRSSARLSLDQHRWADLARSLGMSEQPLLSFIQTDGSLTMDPQPQATGATDDQPAAQTSPTTAEAAFVIRHEDGTEEIVDQQLDQLPFSATGRFEPIQG